MTDNTLVRPRAVTPLVVSLRQQVWMLGISWRWVYLTGGFMAILVALWFTPGVWNPSLLMYVLALAGIFGGAVWTLMVWHGEPPSERGYHWSLPVSRPGHDLARVAAGLPYLIVACLVLTAGFVAVSAAAGTLDAVRGIPVDAWLNFMIAPLLTYLLVSPLALWSDYPIVRWLVGGFMAFAVVAVLTQGMLFDLLNAVMIRIFNQSTFGLANALMSGTGEVMLIGLGVEGVVPPPMWPAVAFWLVIAVGLNVLAATFRPDDLKHQLPTDREPLTANRS